MEMLSIKKVVVVVYVYLIISSVNGFTARTGSGIVWDSRKASFLSDNKQTSSGFWEQQKGLADEMASQSTKTLKREQMEKFEKRRLALVGDTVYFSVFVVCFLWIVSPNPATTISYVVGSTLGVAYAYGLGKSVEQLGSTPDEAAEVERSGFGEARFAFLILLFVVVGKFRSEGLQEIPAIGGFFTYQLASLKQGLQEIND